MTGKIPLRLLACMGALLVLLGGPAAAGQTYYVDQKHPQASDENSGSESAPWKTMYRAMSERLKPGDTVLVAPGDYEARGGTWSSPSLNPATSGTADKPITFRAEPRHGARLLSGGTAPAIGSASRNHIVIDGFEVAKPGSSGVAVFGARGVLVQNMKIHGVRGSGGSNTDGIRIERTSHSTFRDNEIFDVHNGHNSTNAAGVKIYYSNNIVVEHNEIHDVIAGVKDKEEGVNNRVRRNLFHNCRAGMELMNQNHTTTDGYYFYQNIVNCRSGFVGNTNSTATMRNVYIYNNLFYGYSSDGVVGTSHGSNRRIWNNIFHRGSQVRYDLLTRTDPPREFELVDYNLYNREPSTVIGLYQTNRKFNTLSAWQNSGYDFDRNSRVADPQLVDPAKGDFRLRDSSPARNAGRSDGTTSGTRMNLGPYITGNEQIGIRDARQDAPPRAPKELKVN